MTQFKFNECDKVTFEGFEGIVCACCEPEGNEEPYYKVYIKDLGRLISYYESQLEKL